MQMSAGTLLFRHHTGESPTPAPALQVLLVHPSGNYNRQAPWSIPKGIPDAGESLEAAARRETLEETGVNCGELWTLPFVTYRKSRKQVHAFAGPAPEDAAPRCASWEVDRAEFVSLVDARNLLHPDQVPLLDRLLATLADRACPGASQSASPGV